MNKAITSIVVVGGGTAGWITAGRIAAMHCTEHSPISVTLVESATVPTVGVGEGTWPTMRSTLMKLGIRESDFIRECEASFKQGAKFAKWVDGSDDDFYYHPLVLPQGFGATDLAGHWQTKAFNIASKPSFSNAVCYQETLCEHGLAPKTIRQAQYNGTANYAYHLDAGKFTQFLHKHCTSKLKVKHIYDDITSVKSAENGDIAAVVGKTTGEITGDLFIDCSGFQSLLLGQHYQVPFIGCEDVLFIDRALAVQVPYDTPDAPIATHTISTGQDAGWIWDIGLQQRRGVGYVYSSRHSNEEHALQRLADYVGPTFTQLSVKKIPIKSGRRSHFWHKNCVAVGLSAGFLEPLEASALVLVELSAQMIAEQLPACRSIMGNVAKRFNQTFDYRWDRIIDFLKLHYMLSKRTDSDFWIDNRRDESIPESLKEMLEIWRYHPPGDHDFTSNNEVFPAASYQYVLYGMGFETDTRFIEHRLKDSEFAMGQLQQNQHNIQQVLRTLPKHRDLLDKINQYGFQSI